MERLTKTYEDGTHGASDNLPCGENSYDYKNLLLEKLGGYEDLEEQGRLIKLPCKIGDTVWEVNKERNIVSEFTIRSVTKYPLSIQFNWKLVNGIYRNTVGFADFHIGKTVFLTKSEAYEKLKELRGGESE